MRLTMNLPARRAAGTSAAVALGLLLGVGAAHAQPLDDAPGMGSDPAANAAGTLGQDPPPADPAMPGQTPEEASEPREPQLTIEGEVAIIFYNVQSNYTTQFEQLFKKVQEAMLQSDNPVRKQQASGMRLMRSAVSTPGEPVAYVLMIDPVMKAEEYDPGMLTFETFPSEASELFKDLNNWLDPNQPSALIPLNTVMRFGS